LRYCSWILVIPPSLIESRDSQSGRFFSSNIR
jgi:hypothetical protein